MKEAGVSRLAVYHRIGAGESRGMAVSCPVSSGRRNSWMEGGCDGGSAAFGSGCAGEVRSPGRPGVARREERRRFWALIAAGLSSEDAAMAVGVSQPVGSRWFREAGGMPPSHLSRSSKPLSGRYLSLRGAGGDRAAAGAGSWRAGDRPAAGAGAVDDLAGAAAQRGDAQRRPGVPGDDGAVACRAGGPAPEAGEARDERGAAGVRAGAAGGRCRRPGRGRGARAGGAAGRAAGTGRGRTGAGRGRGARSRSPSGCGSTSPMMSRCGSATRRSTRRSTSRAAARCGAS